MGGLIRNSKESPIVIVISFLLTNLEANIEKNQKNYWIEDNVADVTTMYGSQ